MTAIAGSVALVTGGSRGLGKAIVAELLHRGAAKVYATARDPASIGHPGAVPLALEVTDLESVCAAAQAAPDVNILINNAGVGIGASFLDSPIEDIRREFETNFYGPLFTTRAWVPLIERNGGGHILNINSVQSWSAVAGSYSAAKAALWSQTNAVRLELLARGIKVSGLHVGYVDTDMTTAVRLPKANPADIARRALDGVAADEPEILADEISQYIKLVLAQDVSVMYPDLAR
ncbi:short-chain dehydrogenase of uncharacterised substrate specificity [Mycobacteroides abscessus subsp. abscessus]|uniref:SDR family oxidoreductase n=1 Tax=Mycobacteroides abscessus TaxID=36809 RepID=UPI0002584C04|nr:SDR family oxidoreductase [Mycobacteroides abscessus]EIC67561.1 short chain dehydrogenase [Mycobacteroides abscessus M93]CPV55784.1 short-chain dehydrogenase of uncharacterised substrate specificity [Mycobacteroides abscessus]SHQ63541.1 short-chain dehydrogenase of uncharacterised substrate specificity [Mycobacteroides abscessus subsp. abscessus]SHR33676.1 short-chain dehydrogenase of uncharacterised substrate specificity [Mycobacteroides abscessus subsp. abscessus]SHZ30915.1 short-chain de